MPPYGDLLTCLFGCHLRLGVEARFCLWLVVPSTGDAPSDIANYLLSNVTMRAAVRGRFIEMLKTAAEIQHDSDTEETVNDAITTMIFENMPLIKIDTFKEDLKDLSELVNDISARTMATTRATTTTSSRGLSMETRSPPAAADSASKRDWLITK